MMQVQSYAQNGLFNNQYYNNPGYNTMYNNTGFSIPPAPPPPQPVLDTGAGNAMMVGDLEKELVSKAKQKPGKGGGKKGKEGKDSPKHEKKAGKGKGGGKGQEAAAAADATTSTKAEPVSPQADAEMKQIHNMYQQLLQAKGAEYEAARALLKGKENELADTNNRMKALENLRNQLRSQLKPIDRTKLLKYYVPKKKSPVVAPPVPGSPALTPQPKPQDGGLISTPGKDAAQGFRAGAAEFVPSQPQSNAKQFTILDPKTGKPIDSPPPAKSSDPGSFTILDPKTGKPIDSPPVKPAKQEPIVPIPEQFATPNAKKTFQIKDPNTGMAVSPVIKPAAEPLGEVVKPASKNVFAILDPATGKAIV